MPSSIPHYPVVHFIMKSGCLIANSLSCLPIILATAAVICAYPWWWLLAAVGVTPILYLFLHSYVELVRIIGDTLLPR